MDLVDLGIRLTLELGASLVQLDYLHLQVAV